MHNNFTLDNFYSFHLIKRHKICSNVKEMDLWVTVKNMQLVEKLFLL
jgi:hypothetical protein